METCRYLGTKKHLPEEVEEENTSKCFSSAYSMTFFSLISFFFLFLLSLSLSLTLSLSFTPLQSVLFLYSSHFLFLSFFFFSLLNKRENILLSHGQVPFHKVSMKDGAPMAQSLTKNRTVTAGINSNPSLSTFHYYNHNYLTYTTGTYEAQKNNFNILLYI